MFRPWRPYSATTAIRAIGISANFWPLGDREFGLHRGFDVYRSDPDGDCEYQYRSPWKLLAQFVGMGSDCVRYRRAERISDDAIAILDLAKSSKFFLFVNYMDAHSPYKAPDEFKELFNSALPFGRTRSTGGDLQTIAQQRLVDRYDSELSYLDTHVQRLLGRLRKHPAWDDMIVVITSDHGEAFGEHGLFGHTSSLYDEMIRVPLVFRIGDNKSIGEGLSSSMRWTHPVQLVDILPLILGYLNIEPPSTDGLSLQAPTVSRHSWSFSSRGDLRVNDRYRRELRSVETAPWKLIESSTGLIELYDLANDPSERRNLALEEPNRVAYMQMSMGPRKTYRSTKSFKLVEVILTRDYYLT